MAVVPEELVIFAKNKTLKDNRIGCEYSFDNWKQLFNEIIEICSFFIYFPFFSYIFRFPLYYFLDIFQFKFYIHGTRNVLKENEFPF